MRKGGDVKEKQKEVHHTTKLLKGIWGDALMDAGWMQVPRLLRRMRTQLGLTNQEYTILLDYVDYYSYSRSINPYKHLEEVSGLGVRALQNIFASLEKKKLIIREIIIDNKKRKMGIIFTLRPLVTKLHLLVKKTSPGLVIETSPTVGEENFISNTQEELRREETIQESSSKSSSIDNYLGKSSGDDNGDDVFSHRSYIISLYEKYTGNQWRVGDDEFYEGENLKGILPEVIEAAIIASVVRSKTKMNSFTYCKGAIEEFQESLPPGYLSYLRKEWRKAKSEEIERKEDIKNETTSFLLTLPRDSYFEDGWLKNYISGFPKEEQAKVKRLAERFDHFMLTAGEKKEWVKNPTGTFIGLVRGEINVPINKQAPTFEERVEEERRIEEEEKIREQERLEWEREKEKQEQRKGEIEKEIREAISQLSDEDLERFITGARKKYGVKALESDVSVLERVPYLIIHELYERGEENWRRIWKEIDTIDS